MVRYIRDIIEIHDRLVLYTNVPTGSIDLSKDLKNEIERGVIWLDRSRKAMLILRKKLTKLKIL
ncbi:MAG: hypothetical protein ACTSPF_10015 [Candidatus Heimdallarchaeaceae archaeon]